MNKKHTLKSVEKLDEGFLVTFKDGKSFEFTQDMVDQVEEGENRTWCKAAWFELNRDGGVALVDDQKPLRQELEEWQFCTGERGETDKIIKEVQERCEREAEPFRVYTFDGTYYIKHIPSGKSLEVDLEFSPVSYYICHNHRTISFYRSKHNPNKQYIGKMYTYTYDQIYKDIGIKQVTDEMKEGIAIEEVERQGDEVAITLSDGQYFRFSINSHDELIGLPESLEFNVCYDYAGLYFAWLGRILVHSKNDENLEKYNEYCEKLVSALLGRESCEEDFEVHEALDKLYDPHNAHHPSHYTAGGIETIDFIKAKLSEEEYKGYLKGNLIKYISRAGKKGDERADLEKASVYLGWWIDLIS